MKRELLYKLRQPMLSRFTKALRDGIQTVFRNRLTAPRTKAKGIIGNALQSLLEHFNLFLSENSQVLNHFINLDKQQTCSQKQYHFTSSGPDLNEASRRVGIVTRSIEPDYSRLPSVLATRRTQV